MPPSKKDFWRRSPPTLPVCTPPLFLLSPVSFHRSIFTPPTHRTFYNPTMIKGDASALLCEVPADEEVTVEISFSFTPVQQFDQCGVLIYLDASHWLKTGIEFADGSTRLSCVCCNLFSDWSVMPWNGTAARIRIHKINHGNSVAVEANTLHGTDDTWQFIRICHLSAKVAPCNSSNHTHTRIYVNTHHTRTQARTHTIMCT